MWNGCPLGTVYGVAEPVPSYANGYLHVLVPAYKMPLCYKTLTLNRNPGVRSGDDVIKKTEKTKRFLLDRCLFDLVAAHPYLELTDPKLLGWYLGLSAEDRKIIQAEGGLQNFLLRHPALELTPHHVYVKSKGADKAPRSRLPRQNLSSYGISPTEQELNVYSDNMWENSAVSDPTDRQDGSQKQPCEDPGTLASFCLDTALERCRQSRKSKHRSVGSDQTANFTDAEVHPSQSEWSTIKNTSPEHSSSDYLQMDGTENGTKKESQDCRVYKDEGTINTANVGSDQGGDLYTILEEDKSILVCVASSDQKTSRTVSPNGETLAPRSELIDDQSLTNSCSEENGPFLVPRVSSCDKESARCVSAFTQTDDPVAADKQINTEVCMADVDYVAVEFVKLKISQEKLKKKCDCLQRAQQAELSLLSLQYRMCRQHCWSLHCATAGGNQGSARSADVNQHCPEDPRANIGALLNKLESDYNELRGRILEGVPLEQLKPLSVDCGKITPAPYIPAQVIASMQGSVPHQPQDLQRNRTSTNDCQREAKQVTQQNSSARRAVPLVPQASGALCDAQTLADTQTAICKELTTGETWYDAEEDLKLAEPAAGSANEETKSSVHSSSKLGSRGQHRLNTTAPNSASSMWEQLTQPSHGPSVHNSDG